MYLHEHEGALPSAIGLKDKRHRPHRKWLSINELCFANEPVDIYIEDEVRVISVAFITVHMVTDARPAF